jgi:hypothetical protein
MGKTLKKMWGISEIPIYCLIFWSILSVGLLATKLIDTTLQSILGWVVIISAYGYVGYHAKAKGESIGFAAKTGAFAGVIVGFIGAIIGIISYYTMPDLFAQVLADAIENGAPAELTEKMMEIMVYVGLLIQPIFSAVIGALFSALGGLINRK